ncbi:uncharacterized protein VICG_00891 [Vittaforma corneae ATCC 50505]|uniref:CDT1 Geminin-binding domain-containing protein n=1 Tax=Vittaforma corneae (strain ATCC 50505) TaxID=993615 RepID=L2GN50_VITCO|nr:uncharacterized protein VICG_00891 [Vittaforma corneae ATCC 50505]ELA42044.1 hypothetical protein VICG_00891 [Vittaforma corneae ATCC 50505]
MLANFFKKKTRERDIKTDNLEEIQEFLASHDCVVSTQNKSTGSTTGKYSVNKDEKILSYDQKTNTQAHKRIKASSEITNNKLPANKSRKAGHVPDSKQEVLENFSFISNSSASIDKRMQGLMDEPFVIDSNVQRMPPDRHKPFLNEDCTNGDIDFRKIQVMNMATRNIEIKYSPSSATLYLPKNFRLLSTLYKILASVHSFNQRRGLTLIFIKYVESIEKLFKHRVEMALLEQLNFICNGSMVFTPVRILDEGIKKNTFKIDVKEGFDIDIALFNYYCELYYTWLEENNIQGRICRFHPDFIKEEWRIPPKPFLLEVKVPQIEDDIKQLARDKASTIIERIKERERQRKEQFVHECTVKIDYEARIDSIFLLTNKQAMRLEDLIFKVGGFDCKANLMKVFGDRYFVKMIDGEEYVVKK